MNSFTANVRMYEKKKEERTEEFKFLIIGFITCGFVNCNLFVENGRENAILHRWECRI